MAPQSSFDFIHPSFAFLKIVDIVRAKINCSTKNSSEIHAVEESYRISIQGHPGNRVGFKDTWTNTGLMAFQSSTLWVWVSSTSMMTSMAHLLAHSVFEDFNIFVRYTLVYVEETICLNFYTK